MASNHIGPRNDRGRFVPLDCPDPNCGAGRLVYEPEHYALGGTVPVWRCDGLVDPCDTSKELQACEFTHIDGNPYPAKSP